MVIALNDTSIGKLKIADMHPMDDEGREMPKMSAASFGLSS
jgi:hypothetical protein